MDQTSSFHMPSSSLTPPSSPSSTSSLYTSDWITFSSKIGLPSCCVPFTTPPPTILVPLRLTHVLWSWGDKVRELVMALEQGRDWFWSVTIVRGACSRFPFFLWSFFLFCLLVAAVIWGEVPGESVIDELRVESLVTSSKSSYYYSWEDICYCVVRS